MAKIRDLIGQRFGRLVVRGFDRIQNGKSSWRCDCDCGTSITALGSNVSRGHTRSCGCLHDEPDAKHIKALAGHRFGRLLVLHFTCIKGGSAHWLCRCDCGTEKEIVSSYLVSG